jgi:beta-glucosidase
MKHTHSMPADFLWGTATSSYQIEGAVNEDGRGPSIWDDFSHTPGKVKDGGTGDVACDHYHLYRDDVALMKSLGFGAYRFSIAWPRVLPTGEGAVNPKGLDFYNRLVDELLANGITPWVTLYHWDLPSALQRRGGWADRDIAGRFADYTAVVVRALGDRVTHWITLNEPWCTAYLSHDIGLHAPGLKDPALATQVAHHTLLAHGMALQAIRANTPRPADTQAGITLNFEQNMPASNKAADKRAADTDKNWLHDTFVPPVFTGSYDPRWPMPRDVRAGDMALISQRNDFLGINHYTVRRVKDVKGQPVQVRLEDCERTLMDWEVAPDGLYALLLRLHRETKGLVPLYITENGASYVDTIDKRGQINDAKRVAYYRGYLGAVSQAIAAGADVRGYFAWSLLDNFEWAEGYQQFFGIVHVDYKTQKRTPKASAHFLSACIAANAVLAEG